MGYVKYLAVLLSFCMIISACSNDKPSSSGEAFVHSKEELTSQEDAERQVEGENDIIESDEKLSSEKEAEELETETSETKKAAAEKEKLIGEALQPAASENTAGYDWLYEELNGKEFLFSSGAGAWRTHFTFGDQGYFSGKYSDADGPDIIVSEFEGQFVIQEERDEFTYHLDLVQMNVTSDTGRQDPHSDGGGTITYVSEPHGFQSGSSLFELYLPFKPLTELPQAYYSWVQYNINDQYDVLNQFGLYNTVHEFGMIEYFG